MPPLTVATFQIMLANPRGFCAGVERAIAIVEQALNKCGAPVYVKHEVVHNRYVCDDLRSKGAIFVEKLEEVPAASTLIFSAHGVSAKVRKEAEHRGLTIYDATCPLVTKVHLEVRRMHAQRRHTIMIGHRGHPEVEGTMGQVESGSSSAPGVSLVENFADIKQLDFEPDVELAYVTQTTLSVDDVSGLINALRVRFPGIKGPKKDDICYATQNRQDAVKKLAGQCDLVIVVGSPNSSNSNRLREVAQKQGVEAYLIESANSIEQEWISGKRCVGVTAGASAPDALVQNVIERLRHMGGREPPLPVGEAESVVFPLPRELVDS